MKENEILRDILRDVLTGYRYGKDRAWDYYDNKPFRYPYFESALYLTPAGNIGYSHFGSSAIKPTTKNLEWLITVIFDTTPSEFIREYIRNDKSTL